MNQMLATWAVQTRKVEDAIWQRKEAFETRFCRSELLLEVWFGSGHIKVVYLVNDGGTWTDSFPLTELSEFFQDNPL